MKTKLKKWLVRGAIFLFTLALIGLVSQDFWKRQIRIYRLGLMETHAEEFGFSLPPVDEIEVMLTGDEDRNAPDGPDRVHGYQVTGRVILRGEDAEAAAKHWRRLRRGMVFSAICHDPPYALRFRQGGRLLFQTTVCWDCQNYTMPLGMLGTAWYGFDAGDKEAQALLQLLQARLPLTGKPGG